MYKLITRIQQLKVTFKKGPRLSCLTMCEV